MNCLTKHCREPARTRGLCATCYKGASRMIAAGETTWATLEKKGAARAARAARFRAGLETITLRGTR